MANPHLQEHWLVEQIRAVVTVVAKLLPEKDAPIAAARVAVSVTEAVTVGNGTAKSV